MPLTPVSLQQHVREGLIAAINALNELINTENSRSIVYGYWGELGTVTAHSYSEFTVNYPEDKFSSAPTVVVSLYSTSTNTKFGSVQVAVSGETASYFKVRVFNDTDSSVTPSLRYIAIQN